MSVLGVITCEVLENELAYILANDPDVARVTVLEDARSARLVDLLESAGCRKLRRIPHLNSFSAEPLEPLEVLVRVLELALHRNRRILRHAVVAAAREMNRHVDAFLLGYGLCGNALDHPDTMLDVDKPVFVPMDADHPVDDCIGLTIGGRTPYYEEQRKVPGTFFINPGWAFHWRRMFSDDPQKVKRMLARYERVLLISTPIMADDQMKAHIRELADMLGLRIEQRQGSLNILNDTWESAKKVFAGKSGSVPPSVSKGAEGKNHVPDD